MNWPNSVKRIHSGIINTGSAESARDETGQSYKVGPLQGDKTGKTEARMSLKLYMVWC